MKEKNGVNIMLFVFIINLIVILSCVNNNKNPLPGILLQTDRAFSEMSVKDTDGVILSNNEFPLKGIEALKERFSGRSDTAFILSWEPLSEKISESGDLGYTYGIHTNTNKVSGEITKGTYVTIWQKQTDGSWKFVLDTGTQGLPDNKE
jgi:ketosteroid isomerase-like protein